MIRENGKEEFVVDGEKVVPEVKGIFSGLKERKIVFKNKAARNLMELPLLFVIIIVILAPYLALLIVPMLLAGWKIVIEKNFKKVL